MGKPKNQSGVEVIKCDCVHEFQDNRYGAGNRVHTVGNAKRTCTVCGTEKKSW